MNARCAFRRGIKAVQAIFLGCLIGSSAPVSFAYDGAVSIAFENDTFTGSDNNYTNGFGIGWSSAEIKAYDEDALVRRWAEFLAFLPLIHPKNRRTFVSWTLGQEMHTPDDVAEPYPPLDDQPYAGVLYLDTRITSRSSRWSHTWGLRLGMVGPSSGAESVQREVHEITGAEEPRGWDTQMPDEPLVNLSYTFGYLLSQGNWGSADWRVVPIGSVGLGNYFTGVTGGLYTELGWNLADTLAWSSLRNGLNNVLTTGTGPQNGWSLSLFLATGAHGVAHYLPRDGTVFDESQSVDSKPVVGFLSGGISVRRNRFAASLGVTRLSETFATERQRVDYGAVNLAWYL